MQIVTEIQKYVGERDEVKIIHSRTLTSVHLALSYIEQSRVLLLFY